MRLPRILMPLFVAVTAIATTACGAHGGMGGGMNTLQRAQQPGGAKVGAGTLTVTKTDGPDDAPEEAKTVHVEYAFDKDIVQVKGDTKKAQGGDWDKMLMGGKPVPLLKNVMPTNIPIAGPLFLHAHFDMHLRAHRATDVEIFGRPMRKAKEYQLYDVALTKPGDEMGTVPRGVIASAAAPVEEAAKTAKVEVTNVLGEGLGRAEPVAATAKASMPKSLRGFLSKKKKM